MDDAVAVALEARAQRVLGLGVAPAAAVGALHAPRREEARLTLLLRAVGRRCPWTRAQTSAGDSCSTKCAGVPDALRGDEVALVQGHHGVDRRHLDVAVGGVRLGDDRRADDRRALAEPDVDADEAVLDARVDADHRDHRPLEGRRLAARDERRDGVAQQRRVAGHRRGAGHDGHGDARHPQRREQVLDGEIRVRRAAVGGRRVITDAMAAAEARETRAHAVDARGGFARGGRLERAGEDAGQEADVLERVGGGQRHVRPVVEDRERQHAVRRAEGHDRDRLERRARPSRAPRPAAETRRPPRAAARRARAGRAGAARPTPSARAGR